MTQKMLSSYCENHTLEGNKFTEKFIDDLSVNFPEKALKLMGINYIESTLIDYIKENDVTPENFSPESFKYYITLIPFKNQTIRASNTLPTVTSTGDIFFDTTTNSLKIFNGNQWVSVV